MNSPLVTIGITCFNAEDTIARAIKSALAQDWPNIEVIVVDDASSDGSVATVNATVAEDPRTRLIRHDQNAGPAGSRNTILANATGEYVAFIDDDDEALPGRISGQMTVLADYEKHTGSRLVACFASGQRRYDTGYILDMHAIGSRGTERPNGPAVADYLLFGRRRADWFYGAGTGAGSLLARRSAFAETNGFDSKLRRVEDVDFAIRLALKGGHFVGTVEQGFVQYVTSAADKTPEKNLESELILVENFEDYLHSVGRYQYAKRWPKLRYWHFKRRYGRFAWELLGLLVRYPVAVPIHLFLAGPRRLMHERRMRGTRDRQCTSE